MTSRVRTITVDCTDHEKLAAFWSAAIGYDEDPDNPNTPGDPESLLIPRDGKGPALQFIPVPETKAGKNRLHLDIRRPTALETRKWTGCSHSAPRCSMIIVGPTEPGSSF